METVTQVAVIELADKNEGFLLMDSHRGNWNDCNHGKYNLLVVVHNLVYLENLDILCLNSKTEKKMCF